MPSRPIDLVLQRAEGHGLRPSGRGKWRMRGVCHGGRNPWGVSIAEGEDGAVLLKCWAGCSVDQVAGALGLELADLFPPREAPGVGRKAATRPFTASEAIQAFRAELRVAWVILADLAAGRAIDASVRRRAGLARDRCSALLSELDHGR